MHYVINNETSRINRSYANGDFKINFIQQLKYLKKWLNIFGHLLSMRDTWKLFMKREQN